MRTTKLIIVIIVLTIIGFGVNLAINSNKSENIDTRIDSQSYWRKAAEQGLVEFNPDVIVKPAVYRGTNIRATTITTFNSPDIAVTEISSTQSENSVFVNPLDETNILNSNNSTTVTVNTKYGADALFSLTTGETWEGSIEGAGETENAGDPAVIIGLNGRWYVNYINELWGMGVSYSDDQGDTWTVKQAAPNPGIITDKNHMWIDNNPSSPYEGNLYVSWTNIGGDYEAEIGLSYSSDDGDTWTILNDISSGVSAGSHNQGVNLSTGPNGEVYAVWAIYDSWPSGGSDETALGFAVSYDGGVTWEPAQRIIENIRGIRATKTSKDMRVNSFPVATVDKSSGADQGAVYITWSNIGTPGINTGDDIDIYIIKSTDQGNSWSTPLRVNGDEPGFGKQHFFPWITCDPSNGILSMIYYDDRNVNADQCEVYCANSLDGGLSWEEFVVSDVSFTPAPISGLANDYMGDYLGIHSKNGMVYPIWTDNRLGYAMSFCSPFETVTINRPTNLVGDVDFETGTANLLWSYEESDGFLKFIIYRDFDSLTSTTDTTFIDFLPEYNLYNYRVTAYYSEGVESGASGINLQWGDVIANVQPDSIYNHLAIGYQSQNQLILINEGQLDLKYNISLESSTALRGYCEASGGGGAGNEYISGVEVGDISNTNTGSNSYTDYSNLSTTMKVGEEYEITVTNGNPYDLDQCGVWVDWNNDELFDNSELVLMESIPEESNFTGTIVPVPGATSGITKMRVRLTYTGALEPCGNTNFGEVEDYSVFVQGWLDIFPLSGILPSGDTNLISVNYNSVNLEEGFYSTNALIKSNDTANSVIQVPLSLKVDYLTVDVVVDDSEICFGQIIQLTPQVSGLFDTLSYSWSSNPEGFTSDVPRPIALPMVSAWFKIEISDGEHTAIDSVYVKVLELPYVDLGSDTTICSSLIWELDAGSTGLQYIWSTGDTTQTIVIDTTGVGFGNQNISVEVVDSLGCTAYDDINIEFVNCSGINDYNHSGISLYPNPNNGKFCIKTEKISDDYYKLKVINASGIVVYYESDIRMSVAGELHIDIGKQKEGIYNILLYSESLVFTKKVILKNQ